MEILFPYDKFLYGKFPPTLKIPLNPDPPPILNQKIHLKMSVRFPITITICEHWSKFVTCSSSHGNCGGVSRPQIHSY